MPAPVRPASRLFNFILRHTLGAWVARRFRARYDADVLADLKPPYLVIGNHTCFWDPFLMSVPNHYPVHFVASDEYFRTPFMRFVFSLVGGIPKTKNTRDTQTVRTLIGLKRAGAVLGLYPEGNRNWDGVTGPVFAATAKLVRKLAIPVVLVTTTGGTLTQPRGGATGATAGCALLPLLFTPEDCKTLSEQELRRHMVQALAHNDLEASHNLPRAGSHVRFTGRRLASGSSCSCSSARSACRRTRWSPTTTGFLQPVRFYGCIRRDGQFHAAQADKDGTEPLPFANTHRGTGGNATISPEHPGGRAFPALSLHRTGGAGRPPASSRIRSERAPPPGRKRRCSQRRRAAANRRQKRQAAVAGAGHPVAVCQPLRFDADEAGALPISLPIPEISGLNIQYNNRVECYRKGTRSASRSPTPPALLQMASGPVYAGVPGADQEDAAPGSPARKQVRATQEKQEEPAT
jgi:1-acyl-sn-glycerol-3-phosphate acyltransferase